MALFGRQYVLDCCINNYNNAQKKEAYDIYVTDILRIISENTAMLSRGTYMKLRYVDIIEPKKEVKKVNEEKSAKEIVEDIANRSGITVVKNK